MSCLPFFKQNMLQCLEQTVVLKDKRISLPCIYYNVTSSMYTCFLILFPNRWCLITPVWFFFWLLARALNNLLVTLLAALLGEKDSVDVGEHTTLSDGHTGKEFG